MNTNHIKTCVLSLGAMLLTLGVVGQDKKASYSGQEKSKDAEQLQKLSQSSYQQVEIDPSSETNWQTHYDHSWSASVDSRSKQIDIAEQSTLDAIIDGMQEHIPHSYTFYYNNYRNQRHNTDYYSHLELAYDLQPDNPDTYDEFVAYGELINDKTLKKEFSNKLLEANVYSNAVLEYNFNTLNSCSANSILLTNGNEDTYPAWIQQEVFDISTDVQLVNIDLLYSADYCAAVFEEIGVEPMEITRTTDPIDIYEHILDEVRDKDTYLALTAPPEVLKKYHKSLFLTGLAMRYDPDGEFQNLPELHTNWQARFRKEHMRKPDPINKNYVMLLAILNDYYDDIGNIAARDEVRSLLRILVPQTGKSAKVKAITTY